MGGKIELTEVSIKEYLDGCIRFWREKRDYPDISGIKRKQASCYIDAFQSVRTSLFDELLPK